MSLAPACRTSGAALLPTDAAELVRPAGASAEVVAGGARVAPAAAHAGTGVGALRAFYVCFFVCQGVSVPFLPSYLRGLGFSGREVSLLMSVAPLFFLVVPLGLGLARRSHPQAARAAAGGLRGRRRC